MEIRKIIFTFITFISLLTYSTCAFGAETYCGDFFYNNTQGIYSLEAALNAHCNNFLSQKSLYDSTGCLTCNIRIVNGLFDLDESTSMSSICIGSKDTCTSSYNGMEELFTEFMSTVDTSDKIMLLTGQNITLLKTFIEKDQLIDGNNIKASIIKHTANSLTYSISTTLDYPIRCFKALEPKTKELGNGDSYYILKPNTNNRIFTESFQFPIYDCLTYSLQVKCSSIPYQENVAHFFTQNLLSNIEHKDVNTQCNYIDPQPTPDPPSPDPPTPDDPSFVDLDVPQLITINPMKNYNPEVEDFKLKDIKTQLSTITQMAKTFEGEFRTAYTLVDKLNLVIRASKYLAVVNCKQTTETRNCKHQKEELMDEIIDQVEDYFNDDDLPIRGVINILLNDKPNFDYNTKMIFLSMIVVLKNTDILLDHAGEEVIEIINQLMEGSSQLINEVNTNTYITNKTDTQKDYQTLIDESARKLAELTQQGLIVDSESDTDTDDDDGGEVKHKSIRKAVSTLTSYYIKSNIESQDTDLFTFYKVSLHKTTLRELDTKETKEFPAQQMSITIPVGYIKANNADATDISVLVFKKYPLLTNKGLERYSKYAGTVSVYNSLGVEMPRIKLTTNEEVEVRFDRSVVGEQKDKCYRLDYNSDSKPTTESVDTDTSTNNIITCKSTVLGDIFVGKKESSVATSVVIVIVIIVIIALLVGGAWLYKKKTSAKRPLLSSQNENEDFNFIRHDNKIVP